MYSGFWLRKVTQSPSSRSTRKIVRRNFFIHLILPCASPSPLSQQQHHAVDNQRTEADRNHIPPAYPHELIVAVSWKRAPVPNEAVQDNRYLEQKPEHADNRLVDGRHKKRSRQDEHGADQGRHNGLIYGQRSPHHADRAAETDEPE